MKEVYWEIKINNLSGPRQAKLRQKSGPRFVYFDLPIYFLHAYVCLIVCPSAMLPSLIFLSITKINSLTLIYTINFEASQLQ